VPESSNHGVHESIQSEDLRAAYECLRRLPQLTADAPELWKTLAPLIRQLKKALHNHDADTARQIVDQINNIAKAQSPWQHSDSFDLPGRSPYESVSTPERSLRRRRGGSGTRGGLPRVDREKTVLPRRRMKPSQPTPPQRDHQEHIDNLNALNGELESLDGAVRRIPHIDIDADRPLTVGTSFVATVYLDKNKPLDSEEVIEFVVDRRSDDGTALLIGVWLTASAHFKITSDPLRDITLHPDSDKSSKAAFKIEVVDAAPEDAGPPTLKALFDHRLRASGCVLRTLTIEGTTSSTPPPAPRTIAVQTGPADLDMQITVLQGAGNTFLVRTQTPHLEPGGITVTDSWRLPEDNAEKFVGSCMEAFIDEYATALGRQVALRGAGIDFFSAAPRKFRELYWRLVDAGLKPKTIFVISQERSIPWELMIPTRDGEDDDDQLPLGVQCAIGRWYDDSHLDPDRWIPIHDSLVLAPEYESDQLPHAAEEQGLVLKLFPGHPVPATFDKLNAFFKNHSASLLHFACHGVDTTLQSLLLLNNEKLTTTHVRGGGLGAACRAKAPLVFLNACEVGRPGAGLSSPSGFAASLVGAKCGAVIAPLWSVDDEIAHQVAVTFYENVKKTPDKPFAEIIRDLRAKAYQDGGEDTYAAYCFYGHPLASAGEAPEPAVLQKKKG
jgi:hypothetical protein